MADLRLLPMCPEIAEAAYACMQELPPENGFSCASYGAAWEDYQTTHIQGMMDMAAGINLPPEYVPQTCCFLFDGDRAVGLFKVRTRLNDSLRNGSGHIGYGVRQSERGKGYASAGLALAVEFARQHITEDEVYMSVNKDNPASLRVMLKNGAYIHHEDEDHYYTRIKL